MRQSRHEIKFQLQHGFATMRAEAAFVAELNRSTLADCAYDPQGG